MSLPEGSILIVDEARGIYVPTSFARWANGVCVLNVTPADLDELAKGPDEEGYWDLWSEILDAAVIYDAENEMRYTLYQDGDLWLVPVGAEWSDDNE